MFGGSPISSGAPAPSQEQLAAQGFGAAATAGKDNAAANKIGRDVLDFYQTHHAKDVSFIVQNEEIPAHKVVVSARSDYFRTMLYGDMQESHKDRIVINTGISAYLFRKILTFLYSGALDNKSSLQDFMDLLPYANMYQLDELKGLCESLIKHYTTSEQVLRVLRRSRNSDHLKAFAMDYILKHSADAVLLESVNSFPIDDQDDAMMIRDVLVHVMKNSTPRQTSRSTSTAPFGQAPRFGSPRGPNGNQGFSSGFAL